MMQKTSINTIWQFSIVRIISCYAIVLLHTLFASNIYFSSTITDNQFILTKVIENLLMWAVPCFLMVTGALLLDPSREIGLKKLYSKYISRIALTLIIFTLLFRIYSFFVEEDSSEILYSIFFLWIKELLTSTSWAHMWYLYLLIGLYILLPFYRKITANSSKEEIKYLIFVYAIFISIVPMLKIVNVSIGFYLCTTIIYPIYLFLGYYLYKDTRQFKALQVRVLSILSSITIGLLTIIGYFYIEGALDGRSDSIFFSQMFGYSSILVIVQASSIFTLLVKKKKEIQVKTNQFLGKIDKNTFGIYLIHMILVRLTMKTIGFNPYQYGNFAILIFIGMAFVFFILSFSLTEVLKKIPVFKKIL